MWVHTHVKNGHNIYILQTHECAFILNNENFYDYEYMTFGPCVLCQFFPNLQYRCVDRKTHYIQKL